MFILSQLDDTIYNTTNIISITLQKKANKTDVIIQTTQDDNSRFNFLPIATYKNHTYAKKCFSDLFNAIEDDRPTFVFPYE